MVGFYYMLGNVLFCPLWSFLEQKPSSALFSWSMVLLLVAIGITYFVMQSLMTYSMRYTTAAMSSVLIYITVPMSYLLDYLFFK